MQMLEHNGKWLRTQIDLKNPGPFALIYGPLPLPITLIHIHLPQDGMGPLKVIPGGIQLRGEAILLNNLVASRIRSRKATPIRLESPTNISLVARGADGRVHNRLTLG